jgi:hypothetical protein
MGYSVYTTTKTLHFYNSTTGDSKILLNYKLINWLQFRPVILKLVNRINKITSMFCGWQWTCSLRRLACWDCLFESRRGHAYLSLFSLGCQVEVSASGWSLVQRNPNHCGVSECDHEVSIMRMPWHTRGCYAMEKNCLRFSLTSLSTPITATFHLFLWVRNFVSECEEKM